MFLKMQDKVEDPGYEGDRAGLMECVSHAYGETVKLLSTRGDIVSPESWTGRNKNT